MNSIILIAGARVLAVLLLVFSAFMMLRGHNAPGGGFIGGLIAATGFVVYAIACGTADARKALRFDPASIAGAGLGIALLAGVIAMLWGETHDVEAALELADEVSLRGQPADWSSVIIRNADAEVAGALSPTSRFYKEWRG